MKEKPKFNLKVNTIVTSQNYSSVLPIGSLLKGIRCKWKLMHFKPRNRGKKYRKDFWISLPDFTRLVKQVKRSYPFLDIVFSEYDPNEPYEFIIIRPDGFCMIPKGDRYIPLTSVLDPKLEEKIKKFSQDPQRFFRENKKLLRESYDFLD